MLLILVFFNAGQLVRETSISFFGVVSSLLIIINNYIYMKDNDVFDGILSFTLSFATILYSILMLNNIFDEVISINSSIIICSLMQFFIYNKNDNSILNSTGCILSSLAIIISNIIILFNDNYVLSLVFSVLFVIACIYNVYKNNNKVSSSFSKVVQFIGVFILSISCTNYIEEVFTINLKTNATLQIALLLCGVILAVEKKLFGNSKSYTKISVGIIVSFIVMNLFGLFFTDNVVNLVLAVIMFIIKYLLINEDEVERIYLFDSIMMFALVNNLIRIFYVNNINTIGNIILFIVLCFISYNKKDSKKSLGFNLIISNIPLFIIINSNINNENIVTALQTIALLLDLFVVTKIILENPKSAKLSEIFGTLFIFALYIFKPELSLGIFTGVITIIMILIGTKYDKYSSLFISGIVVLCINIIVQLYEFWSKVPIFIYLLLGGLILIGYVTYKELNKNKVKEEKTKPIIEKLVEEKNGIIYEWDIILSIIMVILSILIPKFIYIYDNTMYDFDKQSNYNNKDNYYEEDYYNNSKNNYNDEVINPTQELFDKDVQDLENIRYYYYEYDSNFQYFDVKNNIMYIKKSFNNRLAKLEYFLTKKGYSDGNIIVKRISDECFENKRKIDLNSCEVLKTYVYKFDNNPHQSELNNIKMYISNSGDFNSYLEIINENNKIHIKYDQYATHDIKICFTYDSSNLPYKEHLYNFNITDEYNNKLIGGSISNTACHTAKSNGGELYLEITVDN